MAFNQTGSLIQHQETNTQAAYNQTAVSLTKSALGALNQAMTSLSNTALQDKQRNDKILKEKFIRQGMEDGTINVSPEQYNADLREENVNSSTYAYDVAYNEAQRAATATNIIRTVNTESVLLAQEYSDDPDGFQAAIENMGTTLRDKLELDDTGSAVLARSTQETLAQYLPNITKNGYAAAKKLEVSNYNDGIDTKLNLGLNAIRAGADEAIVEQLITDATLGFDEGVKRGIYSEADRHTFMDGVMLSAEEQLVLGIADKAVKAQDFNGGRQVIDNWYSSEAKSGHFTPNELDAIRNKALQDISQAESALNKQRKEAAKSNGKILQLTDYQTRVDNSRKSGIGLSNTSDNQQAVDAVFLADMVGVPVATFGSDKEVKRLLSSADYQQLLNTVMRTPEGQAKLVDFVEEVNLVPTEVVNTLDAGIQTNDPVLTQQGANLYRQLSGLNSKVMANSFSTKTMAYYGHYNKLVDAGYSPEEATESANKSISDTDSPTRKLLQTSMSNKDYRKDRTNAAKSYASNAPDSNWLGFGGTTPDLGEPINQEFVANYNTIYDDVYMNSNGDAELAKSVADTQIQRKWGRTSINGVDQFMRYSPEAIYGNGIDDDWITNDWSADVESIKSNLKLGEDAKVTLISDFTTGTSLDYAILISHTDSNGIPSVEFLTDNDGSMVRWKPTPPASEVASVEVDKAYEKAKQQREANNVLSRTGSSIPRVTYYNYSPQKHGVTNYGTSN